MSPVYVDPDGRVHLPGPSRPHRWPACRPLVRPPCRFSGGEVVMETMAPADAGAECSNPSVTEWRLVASLCNSASHSGCEMRQLRWLGSGLEAHRPGRDGRPLRRGPVPTSPPTMSAEGKTPQPQ